MERIVHLDNAGVSLGGRKILSDLDLTLDPGESVGVVGPNGSGKTTLARAVATLIKADAGTVSVLGVDPGRDDPREARRSIGLIGHQPALLGELTLLENLDHFMRLAGGDPGRVLNALDVVGLGDVADRRASACSFGMQRRAEIAHLLMSRPRLLLLDEAATGLDESAQGLVEALVASVRDRSGAVLVVSHDRRQLDTLCDSVRSLRHGRLEDSG